MKAVVVLLGVGLLLGMLGGGIMVSINSFRGVDFSEPHIVATGGGVTSTTAVLANEVLDNSTTNITVVSSNSGDAPIPYLYTSINRQLTINGLAESDSRTLTITYKVARQDTFTDLAARMIPSMLIIGAIGCVVGAVITAVRGG